MWQMDAPPWDSFKQRLLEVESACAAARQVRKQLFGLGWAGRKGFY